MTIFERLQNVWLCFDFRQAWEELTYRPREWLAGNRGMGAFSQAPAAVNEEEEVLNGTD